jgi:hypothetical protein
LQNLIDDARAEGRAMGEVAILKRQAERAVAIRKSRQQHALGRVGEVAQHFNGFGGGKMFQNVESGDQCERLLGVPHAQRIDRTVSLEAIHGGNFQQVVLNFDADGVGPFVSGEAQKISIAETDLKDQPTRALPVRPHPRSKPAGRPR